MTPNETIILIILIAIIIAIVCFLVVFCIEHFSKLSVYDTERIQINFREDNVKGQEIVVVKETKGKKANKGKNDELDQEAAPFSCVITAKELIAVLDEIETRAKKKRLLEGNAPGGDFSINKKEGN